MYQYDTQIRVRYAETDQMGRVYHSNFAIYYEVGRVEMLREMGYPYKMLEEKGVQMPVLELHSKFLKPALYDDLLTIRVIVPKMPSVKMFFNFEVYNEKQELLNTGEMTLFFIDAHTQKPCKCPAEILDLFQKYF